MFFIKPDAPAFSLELNHMGDKVNGVATNVLGWLAALLMFAAAVAMLATWN